MTDTIKAKPTLGPWEHNDAGLIFGQVSGDDDEAPFVADVIEDEVHAALGLISSREQANAHLIAAAPELLEALETYFSEMEIGDAGQRDMELFERKALAAIAKAEGRA